MSLKYQEIINNMSLAEKATMMSGKSVWHTQDYPEHNIPSMMLSDGPHGMRTQAGDSDHLGINASIPATCFPTAATVANSWDESLGEEIGKALAEEAVTMGVHVILGPGLNIKRSPLCGRNFEYFSEDPYHAGKMAAAYVKGIQGKGLSACPKHFAANSQELRRMANNSVVDERTFREIYLTGFEIAVKEGKAKSIMSSYNEINGVYANENKHLLRDILVDEWGFDGFVVSDWGASNDHALGVKHGSHLEMPGTGKVGKKEILKAIEEGKLTEDELDRMLDELLDVIYMVQPAVSGKKGTAFDIEAHHALARKVAEQSIVLLKNQDKVLPLAEGTKVLVVGDFAKTARYQGAGSSLVNPTKTPESILDTIEGSGLVMTQYAQGYERNAAPNRKLIEEAVKMAKDAGTVLVFAGLDEASESEGMDRLHMQMPKAQNELISVLAANHSNVIVVLSAGSAIEMPWADDVKAIVHGYLGGQAGASAMLNVLTGKVNPSGKLNESYPYEYKDTPAYAYYPGKERNSEFREGIYVGYRYYETVGKNVAFPFGYGLSYTTFAYKGLKVDKNGATFTIQNTGDTAGAEVAQLYVGKESDTVFRPVRELKGFTKVFLNPGEEKEVTIPFDDKTFRFFDVRTDTWETETGAYTIMIGSDAHTVCLSDTLQVQGTVQEGPYTKDAYETYFAADVTNVSDQAFEILYGRKLPDGKWGKEIGLNDTLGQFCYAKGLLARLIYKIMHGRLVKAEKKGNADLNILFIFNMPIRGMSRMAGGMVSMEMCEAVTEIANGHGFKGIWHFVKGFFRR